MVEALSWAAGYFQEIKTELTPDGSRQRVETERVKNAMYSYDSVKHRRRNTNLTDADADADALKSYFRTIRPEDNDLFDLAIGLIDRGEPIPTGLRASVIEILRREQRKSMPISNLKRRNECIGNAVLLIAIRYRLPATRHKRDRGRRPSAASIVYEALEKSGARFPGSEDAINKICEGEGFEIRMQMLGVPSTYTSTKKGKARFVRKDIKR